MMSATPVRSRPFVFALGLVAAWTPACSHEPEDSAQHHATYAERPNALAVDGDTLFVAVGSRIEARDATGAGPRTLTDAEPAANGADGLFAGPRDLHVHGDFLYWTRWPLGSNRDVKLSSGPNELVRMPKTGGPAVVLASSGSAAFVITLVTDEGIYACADPRGSGGPRLVTMSLDGTGVTTSSPLGQAGDRCLDLFADDGGVRLQAAIARTRTWFDVSAGASVAPAASEPIRAGVRWEGTTVSSDLTLTKRDGARVVLTTQVPTAVTFDGTTAYFTSGTAGGNRRTGQCETGKVSAVSEGHPARIIAEAQCSPVVYAIARDRLFWLDDESLLDASNEPKTVLKSVAR